MTEPLRIAVAGLGTVGAGVIRLLAEHGDLIESRAGRRIKIVAVSARDRDRDRGVSLKGLAWCDNPVELAARDDIDAIVEVIGGTGDPARSLCEAALDQGISIVTANKALIAEHGFALASRAEAKGAELMFEAAVAGGTPVINGLGAGLSANRITRLQGILNGTSNYILSAMEQSGREFGDVLGEAQAKGYAEADPTLDIGGGDAAHKLAILAALAFGTQPDLAHVEVDGITAVRACDIAQAKRLGYVIRLIAMADLDTSVDGEPRLLQRVRPCLVAKGQPLAAIEGATNAVLAEGDFSGPILLRGAGAGERPTASAVVADLIALARGEARPAFAVRTADLIASQPADSGERRSRYYLRFIVTDRPGVLAELAAAMRDARVSIQSLFQEGETVAEDADGIVVALVTHESPAQSVRAALAALESSPSLVEPPLAMPILAA